MRPRATLTALLVPLLAFAAPAAAVDEAGSTGVPSCVDVFYRDIAEATGVWASRMGDAVQLTVSSVTPEDGLTMWVTIDSAACGPTSDPDAPSLGVGRSSLRHVEDLPVLP